MAEKGSRSIVCVLRMRTLEELFSSRDLEAVPSPLLEAEAAVEDEEDTL